MGGSWEGDMNDCWDYCYGKEASVISQLDSIVQDQNFDGVDIDYEYFYDTEPARNFIRTVTTGLRETLPIGTEITHAPMDPDLLPHTEYYKILKDVANDLDFIMPQYYNGNTRPVSDGIDGTGAGSISALSHYETLVDDMFDGDATKVVFGLCINGCAGQATGPEAAMIMSDLRDHYPCNGGAMFWMVSEDMGGSWSELVSDEILPYAGCSSGSPIAPPIESPIAPTIESPVAPPFESPLAPPLATPVAPPV